MSRKIIGITVGTSISPQAAIEKTEQAKQIEQNTIDISNKVDQAALQSEIDRAIAREDELQANIDKFVECTEEDIIGLFNN